MSCIHGRIGSLSHSEIPESYVINYPQIHTVANKVQPSQASATSLSMCWNWGYESIDVINTSTGKCAYLEPSVVSKHMLYKLFLTTWTKLREKKMVYPSSVGGKEEIVTTPISETTYYQAKQYSRGYQQTKEIFFSHLKPICGSWVKKPRELEQFTEKI